MSYSGLHSGGGGTHKKCQTCGGCYFCGVCGTSYCVCYTRTFIRPPSNTNENIKCKCSNCKEIYSASILSIEIQRMLDVTKSKCLNLCCKKSCQETAVVNGTFEEWLQYLEK
jgi:hypothetical protein